MRGVFWVGLGLFRPAESRKMTKPNLAKMLLLHKDRAAPPIGGPALHHSGVKTVQRREHEGHDSYQEVEVIYVYVPNICWKCWHCCGMVREIYTYLVNGLWCN